MLCLCVHDCILCVLHVTAEPGQTRGVILARAILHAAAAALRSARNTPPTPSSTASTVVTVTTTADAQLALLQLAHLCLTLLAAREDAEATVAQEKNARPTDSPELCAELAAALEVRKLQLTAVRRALLCSAAEARLACATAATAAVGSGSGSSSASSGSAGLALVKRKAAELELACCTVAERAARASAVAAAAANGHANGKHCYTATIVLLAI
jgi:hypothetical protein